MKFTLLTTVLAQDPVAFDFPSPTSTDIAGYINSFYNTAVLIAGIVAVAMIVIGAIYYTVSGGSQDKQREGKDIITSAIWGVVLLLGAYVILNTINPELVSLSPPGGPAPFCIGPDDPRPHCEPNQESDPEAHDCCIPQSALVEQEIITCPQEIIDACESPVVWSDGMKIPDCRDKTNFHCHTQWSWNIDVNPETGSGIYYQWVYYPKNTDPGATDIPQINEPKCIIYSYKISADDEKFIMPGLFGLKKC